MRAWLANGGEAGVGGEVQQRLHDVAVALHEKCAAHLLARMEVIGVGCECGGRAAHTRLARERLVGQQAESVAHNEPQREVTHAVAGLHGQHRQIGGAVRSCAGNEQRAAQQQGARMKLGKRALLDLFCRLALYVLEMDERAEVGARAQVRRGALKQLRHSAAEGANGGGRAGCALHSDGGRKSRSRRSWQHERRIHIVLTYVPLCRFT